MRTTRDESACRKTAPRKAQRPAAGECSSGKKWDGGDEARSQKENFVLEVVILFLRILLRIPLFDLF